MRVLANSSMLMVYFGLLIIPISTVGLLGVKYSYNGNSFSDQVLGKQDYRVDDATEPNKETDPKSLPSSADGSDNSEDNNKSFEEFSKDLMSTFETTDTVTTQ